MKHFHAAMNLVLRMGRRRSHRLATAARSILASPVRLALFLAAVLPAAALAADLKEWVPPEFIGALEGVPLPFSPGPSLFVFCVILGLAAGLAGGLGQACSTFAVTPALMSFGVRGLVAVGTDLLANTVFGLTGLLARKKEAPGNGKAAAFLILGAVPGAVGAGFLLKIIHFDNPSACDALISMALVVLFGAFSFNAMLDLIRTRKQAASAPATAGEEEEEEESRREEEEEDEEGFAPPPETMSGVEVGGKTIPVWVFILIGLGMGFLAGLAGSSVGLGLFPVLCGWLPFPAATAATTSLSTMLFTSLAAGAGLFASFGLVAYTAVAGLALGMVPGLAIGALAASEADPVITKALFAATVIGCFANRLLGLPLSLSRGDMLPLARSTAESMDNIGLGFLMVPAGLLGLWLLAMFVLKLKTLRDAHALSPLTHVKVLLMGSAPMVAFLAGAVFVFGFSTLGASFLDRTQSMANALVKHRADHTAAIARQTTPFRNKPFKVTLSFSGLQAAEQAAVVLHKTGLQVVMDKKNLTVLGDTGRFMARLLNITRAMYANDARGSFELLGLPAKNGGYSLWRTLGVMHPAMAKAGMAEAARLVGDIRTRALVPAYNFYTVPTASLKTFILSGVVAGLGALLAAFWWGGGALITMEVLGFAYNPAKRVLTAEEKEKLEQLKRQKEKEKEQKAKKKKKKNVVDAAPPAAAAKVEAEENKAKKKKKKKPAAYSGEDPAKKKKKKRAPKAKDTEKPAADKKKKKTSAKSAEKGAPVKKKTAKKKDADAKPAKKKAAKKKKPAKPVKLEL